MKVLGVISTTALLLILGAAVPSYAQDEHQDKDAKSEKQEPAKPAQHEEQAQRARGARREARAEQRDEADRAALGDHVRRARRLRWRRLDHDRVVELWRRVDRQRGRHAARRAAGKMREVLEPIRAGLHVRVREIDLAAIDHDLIRARAVAIGRDVVRTKGLAGRAIAARLAVREHVRVIVQQLQRTNGRAAVDELALIGSGHATSSEHDREHERDGLHA